MKRLLRLASATVALGTVLATPLAASAAIQERFSVAGPGAEALFSTCPGIPPIGQVCTDTYILAADQVTKAGGIKSSGATLFYDAFSYTCDPTSCAMVSDTGGFGLASLSIDSKLTKASAAATVPVTTCVPDGSGGITCADAGFATVSASWTGVGDLQRQVVNAHYFSRTFSEKLHFNGSIRYASASATVNGHDLGVSDFLGDMFNIKQTDISICHIC
jgi:hypothetical protein